MEREKAELLDEKEAEITWRKEKMNALKKQICEMLTGNSLYVKLFTVSVTVPCVIYIYIYIYTVIIK